MLVNRAYVAIASVFGHHALSSKSAEQRLTGRVTVSRASRVRVNVSIKQI